MAYNETIQRSGALGNSVRKLAKPGEKVHDIAGLVFEMLNGSTKVHINHLLISGDAAYAAHNAMSGFYDDIKYKADRIAEQYQGATETLLNFPTEAKLPQMKTSEACIEYLRTLYTRVEAAQKACKYSEIINQLDEVKSLINTTKYKLLFLK